MQQEQQIAWEMSSLKPRYSKNVTSKAFWRNFKPFKQFQLIHQAVTVLTIILLMFCTGFNGHLNKTIAATTRTTTEATRTPNGNIGQAISNFLDTTQNIIARGEANDHERGTDRSAKEDNKSKIHSSRKSFPGMINDNTLFRPTTNKRRKTKEREEEEGGGGGGGEGKGTKTTGIELIAGRRSQEGVIEFGHTVGQQARFAVQQRSNEEKEEAEELAEIQQQLKQQDSQLALQDIGLEHRNNRKRSNNKSKNNYHDIQDDSDHNSKNIKNKQTLSTSRQKRFQDSDRSQISGIIDEDSDNSDSASFTSSSSPDFVAKSDGKSVKETNSKSPSTFESVTKDLKCRVERDLYLDFETYKHYSCANCYNGMPDFLFTTKLFYDRRKDRMRLTDFSKNRKLLPNETEIIRLTFRAENTFKNWQECCVKALECCIENQKYLPKTYNQFGNLIDDRPENGANRDKCHATWDGLGCWSDSPAGTTAYRDCPDHAYFLEFVPICRGRVSKQCFSNGSWFMRTDHEWSDYSGCSGKAIYGTRLLIASVWHLVSVIIIGPALIVLSKLPNRGGSKRVRILSNLLFWLLLNGLLAATYKIGIIGGYFQRTDSNSDDLPLPPTSPAAGKGAGNERRFDVGSGSKQALIHDNDVNKKRLKRNLRHILNLNFSHLDIAKNEEVRGELREQEGQNEKFFDLWRQRLQRPRYRFKFLNRKYGRKDICDSNEDYENNEYNSKQYSSTLLDYDDNKNSKEHFGHDEQHFKGGVVKKYNHLRESPSKTTLNKTDNHHATKRSPFKNLNSQPKSLQQDSQHLNAGETGGGPNSNNNEIASSSSSPSSLLINKFNPSLKKISSSLSIDSSNTLYGARCKRDTKHKKKQEQSTILVFICWIFSVGIRITRLLGYAWMFTGAVYLCSVLHFAPAEPSASYIKWLMCLTNGFPVVIGLTYMIVRTILEPSPLNLLVKVPYYHFMGDTKQVDYLWASQLTCWTGQSKYDYIEEIADSPNFVLVCLNGLLFVVTLIIMCRITRPGSTRPEMSLGDYFKAAGTLVLLYGAHYALFAYRPPEENCIMGQVMHYSFLFVDGIQGMAVSYVFCYRTSEGKEIIHKWFTSLRESNRLQWCGFSRKKHVQITTSSKHGLLRASNKSNQSTRSTNSACNGNDPATELININNNNSRMASQF